MGKPEMRCTDFVEEVSDWIEGGLSDDRRQLLEEHVSFCPGCCVYLEQTRAAVNGIAFDVLAADLAAGGEAPSPGLRSALLEAFRASRSID
jgi:hypothetical protein